MKRLQKTIKALALATALSVLSWPWCHGGESVASAHGAAAPASAPSAQAHWSAGSAPGAGSPAVGCCVGAQSPMQADVGLAQPAQQFPGAFRPLALAVLPPFVAFRATVPVASLAPHRASLFRQAVLIRI